METYEINKEISFSVLPYHRIFILTFSRCLLIAVFSVFILPCLPFLVFADTALPLNKINLSTPSARNVLSGRIMSPELKNASWKKYDYEAGFSLLGERHKIYPSVFILAGKGEAMLPPMAGRAMPIKTAEAMPGAVSRAMPIKTAKNAFGISYFNSTLPFIKDKYDFLRSNDIAVRRIINSVKVGADTVTYITDEISQFHSRTQILDFLYIRTFMSGEEKYEFAFIAGIPLAHNSYSLRCTLDDGSGYSESGSSFGAGLSAGLKLTAANSLFFSKGIVFSAGVIYRKLWFKGIAGKIDGPLRSEISGIRFFLNAAWRFNFYT
ncbi:MAG: hypothetical protein L6420_11360 [Elusimicrobia bacterium]|nr:hypothetical protein [Elusimicrobiota bacterium]